MARRGLSSRRRSRRRVRRTTGFRKRAASNVAAKKTIVRGTDMLLGVLPGAESFTKIADFIFKPIGLLKSIIDVSKPMPQTAEVAFNGASALFFLPLVRFALNTQIGILNTSGFQNMKTYTTKYPFGRLLMMTVTATPTADLQYRGGNWALGLIPFASDTSEKQIKNNASVPVYRDVLNYTYSKCGSANVPLSIVYRPRIHDGFVYQPHFLSKNIAALAIAYEDVNRITGHQIDPSEFGCEIKLHGAIQLENPFANSISQTFSTAMIDPLTPIQGRVGRYHLEDMICVNREEVCEVAAVWKATRLKAFLD